MQPHSDPEAVWMEGTVKVLFRDRGYGFIAADGYKDTYFELPALGGALVRKGEKVRFRIGPGPDGRPVAVRVKKIPPRSPESQRAPKQRAPTAASRKPQMLAGAATGAMFGGVLGPVGAVVGAAIGALAAAPNTATCLRCGELASETARDSERVGFHCGRCNRFWTARR